MEKMNIIDLIHIGTEDHTEELSRKIDSNPEYQKIEKEFYKHIETLKGDYPSLRLEIEACVSAMANIGRETSFNEGFKLGIQLILSSMN